jgi:BirA family transcriptional regulator, biotin operon repressor / biotin---[acetyl-CoA-carboxylase] ligase
LMASEAGRSDLQLGAAAKNKGTRLVVLDEVGSTNDEAMQRARDGDAGNAWIVAKEQKSGKGRQARNWSSPPGNLYSSLLLINPAPMDRAPEMGFVAGVALAQTLRTLLGGDERLRIKWPNDILHDGAKLCGMLLEGARLADGRFACVIGIGVNCTSHPHGLAYRTTDLQEIGTSLCEPADVLARSSDALVEWLAIWNGGQGFETVRKAWLALAAGLGGPIKVNSGLHSVEGVFSTIDKSGRLVVDTAQGPRTIDAGDVFIGAPNGGTRAGL